MTVPTRLSVAILAISLWTGACGRAPRLELEVGPAGVAIEETRLLIAVPVENKGRTPAERIEITSVRLDQAGTSLTPMRRAASRRSDRMTLLS